MRDTTLYQHLLGIEYPWTVSKVELDVEKQQVDVWVEHPKGLQWPCPECGMEGPLHDHVGLKVVQLPLVPPVLDGGGTDPEPLCDLLLDQIFFLYALKFYEKIA